MSNVNYENKECSYCGSKMKIAKLRVKRPVPQGAKDLGLFDEVVCWQCVQCEQTTTEMIEACKCGSYILSRRNAAPPPDAYEENAPHFQVKLFQVMDVQSGNEFGCTACTTCYGCRKSLNTYDFVEGKDYNNVIINEISYDNKQISQIYYTYFHQQCLDKKQREDAEKKRQQAEESKRRLEEKKRRKEQEQMEREKQRRIKNGLCITCGTPLGFTDKLTGRQSHRRC
jgi:hypothetical protein